MSSSEATPDGRRPIEDPLVERIAALSECVDPVPESVKDAAKALFKQRRARSESAQPEPVEAKRDEEAAKSSTRS
jgi:hypothetical protein